MAVTYYALLTTIGAGKLANATALGTTLKITQLAVGDGGGNVPTPDASRTQLVNEVRRAPLNRLSVDPANGAQIIAEQVIPEDVGGWWIREMGLYDEAGALIAYANCAPSYKPQLAEGSGRTQTVRIVLIRARNCRAQSMHDAIPCRGGVMLRRTPWAACSRPAGALASGQSMRGCRLPRALPPV